MNKRRVLLISRDPDLLRRVESAADAFVCDVRRVASPDGVEADDVGLYLVDLRHNAEASLALAHQIKRRRGDVAVLALHEDKDPDVLLQSLRFGLDDYVDLSEPDRALRESVRKAVHRHETGREEGEAVGVFSLKGGQGVTTLAINLADCAARFTGERVLLLDMHLDYSHAANYLDLSVDFTPAQLADDLERMDDVLLSSSVTETEHGWHLLAVPPREISAPDLLTADDIPELVAFLKSHYRYILVDLPHHLSAAHAAALRACERLLLPFRQDVQAVRALQTAVAFCQEIGFSESALLPVLMAADGQAPLREDDLSAMLPTPVAHKIENSPQVFNTALELRAPLAVAAPDTAALRQIEALAARLTNTPTSAASGPWWSRLFRSGRGGGERGAS